MRNLSYIEVKNVYIVMSSLKEIRALWTVDEAANMKTREARHYMEKRNTKKTEQW